MLYILTAFIKTFYKILTFSENDHIKKNPSSSTLNEQFGKLDPEKPWKN